MDEPAASISRHRVAELVFLAVLAGVVLLYCVDAVRASRHILNLILVLPLSITVLALCTVQFVLSARASRSDGADAAPKGLPTLPAPATDKATSRDAEARHIAEVLPTIGLFAAYIVTLPWFGFDVGTCGFLAVFLWLQGERRWPWLVGYSIGFSLAIAYFFSRMLPYPMPLLIIGAG